MSDDFRLVNTTYRDLRFVRPGKGEILVPRSGIFTNVVKDVRSVYDVCGVPVVEGALTVTGLPDREDGTGYIVTSRTLLVMKAMGFDCSDVMCPEGIIRDDSGQAQAATALLRLPDYS